MTFISTQSFSSVLRQSVTQAQASLAQVQTEISTGAPADLGLTLGAQTGTSLSLKSQIDQLTALTSANSFTTNRLATTATALDTMIASAQSLSQTLLSASSTGGSTSALQSTGTTGLQSLISALNTSVGGQYVFGGTNTADTPIADYFSSTTSSAKQAVDTAFSSAFGTSQTSASASSITGDQMSSFLDNQFAALFGASAWQSTWSSASNQTLQSTISPSQTATTSVSGNSTAFRQIAEAYTMLTEFTGSNFSSDAQSAVVAKASSLVNSALSSLTDIQAGVGVTQNAVSSADSSMSSQMTVLKTNVSDLESVDTYDLSTKLTQLQTQLEASYEITDQLHTLSLTNYLTTTG